MDQEHRLGAHPASGDPAPPEPAGCQEPGPEPFAYHVPPPDLITAADMAGPPFWHTREFTNDPFYLEDGVELLRGERHRSVLQAAAACARPTLDLSAEPDIPF